MSDFLERVVAERWADARALDRTRLAEEAASAPAPRDFAAALRVTTGRAVIAEVKRVSPALGPLAPIADPADLARRYEAAGAAAISVLAERRHWGGTLDDVRSVRAAVRVPVLCKDVIVDARQVLAARAAGADAVLLIGEALDDAALAALLACANDLGMTALVEAHEREAFRRVLASGAAVVGVNARDLRRPATLVPRRVHELSGEVGPGTVLVAESGIASAADAAALPGRVDAMLVGTALVRSGDPRLLIRELSVAERADTTGGRAG